MEKQGTLRARNIEESQASRNDLLQKKKKLLMMMIPSRLGPRWSPRGDLNASNGPSSRFATRLTIKFDFSWHHDDRDHARVKSYGILSKIISV